VSGLPKGVVFEDGKLKIEVKDEALAGGWNVN
jgi:hypothetical protein